MRFSPKKYERAVAYYKDTWEAADRALYDLCRRYPDQCDRAGVYAKIFLIGRAYMTGIERKISSDGTSASSLIQVGEHMLRNRTSLQEIFASLADVAEPLTPENLRKIIHAHGQFVRLLQRITRNEESPRSFCSKYMHFHCPAVPLFDDKVTKVLPKLVRWQKSFQLFDLPNDADEYYARYVLRFWQLYQQIAAAGKTPTVKHVDQYLLWGADGAE
jgi:hypothetical protein